MEIRKAHFPGRSPIDAYGDGGFRFAEMSHHGSLLCIPSGIYGWVPASASEFSLEAFERIFEEQADIEVLLVGTGRDLIPLPAPLKDAFREAGILADPMSTGAAIRTYNVLLAEDRAVATALIAVD